MEWITANIGTIFAALLLILLVVLVIRKMIKDKKAGKASCSSGCLNCAMRENCHSDKKKV